MAVGRSSGTGSLWERTDRGGSVTFYGEWRADGRKVRRRVGPQRAEGGRDGLTRAQAEREVSKSPRLTDRRDQASTGGCSV